MTNKHVEGMLKDAALCEARSNANTLVSDLCCHIKALAEEREQLLKCLAACEQRLMLEGTSKAWPEIEAARKVLRDNSVDYF